MLAVGVWFLNSHMRRTGLKDKMIEWRMSAEAKHTGMGIPLLEWDLLLKTKGGRRTGPTFDSKLASRKGERVGIIGFMAPIYQYRGMTEFLLLPMPIECYFCEAPPMREVILVQVMEGASFDLYREPVYVNGELELYEGPGTKFFYALKDADLGAGDLGTELTPKSVPMEHRRHAPTPDNDMLEGIRRPGGGAATAE